jgi:hypothetical protein
VKGEGDDRGLFRGSELPKLVILGGVLIAGWLLVFSYALPARKTPRPVNPAIANQPKLPPADPALAGVTDRLDLDPRERLGLGARDIIPFELLLDRVRKDPAKLSREARREVVPFDLLKSPKRYRGLPIRMEGYATQAYANDDWAATVTPKGRLYEVWFVQEEHEERMYPCILFAEEVPATLPGGRNFRERVTFEGYFLRLYHFLRTDGKVHPAPLLIGRLSHQPGADEAENPPKADFSEWFWANRWTIVPVLAVLYIAIRVAFKMTKPKVRPLPRTFSRPNDAIDPDDLKQWVEGEKAGDPNAP